VPLPFAATPEHRVALSGAARRKVIAGISQSAPQGLRLWPLASLRLWHLSSLDAPSVAVVWSLAFAWSAGVHLQPWVPAIQALGVWTIYVADRLLDTHRALHNGSIDNLRERHFFHWRHRLIFLPLAVVAACVCACLIFRFMPLIARQRDSFFAAAAFLYLTRVHSAGAASRPSLASRFPLTSKEFFVGLLFTTGCVLPAIARVAAAGQPLWPLLVPAFFFAFLGWLNCHAIDRWESQQPARPAPIISVAACSFAAVCLLTAACLLPVSTAHVAYPRTAELLASASACALLLALLDRARSRLAPLTLRAAADLALLAPLALLLR
jgi:hypothetical protein